MSEVRFYWVSRWITPIILNQTDIQFTLILFLHHKRLFLTTRVISVNKQQQLLFTLYEKWTCKKQALMVMTYAGSVHSRITLWYVYFVQITLSKVHKMTQEVWNKCICRKSQQILNVVDRVVLPEFHCRKNFDPSMLRLQVQLHLHIVETCVLTTTYVILCTFDSVICTK